MIKKLICEECGVRFERDLLPWEQPKDIVPCHCATCIKAIHERGKRRAAQEKKMANVSRKNMYDCPSCGSMLSLTDEIDACPVCKKPLTPDGAARFAPFTEQEIFGGLMEREKAIDIESEILTIEQQILPDLFEGLNALTHPSHKTKDNDLRHFDIENYEHDIAEAEGRLTTLRQTLRKAHE
ncbi:MAG: hypothetical protein GY801_40340 [bacterium]|nr:hypothetical protein [bacterium]